jgi:hypothetical protein
MKNAKNALAILLQISTVILTTITHYCTLVFLVVDGIKLPTFVVFAIPLIVETIIYSANVATFRNCKKRLISSCTAFLVIAFVLNVPITILLLCMYIGNM